jgi:type IV fimbrial biogenesis protein FimT
MTVKAKPGAQSLSVWWANSKQTGFNATNQQGCTSDLFSMRSSTMIRSSMRFFNTGFTLVELMATLAVSLIVLTLGIPGFSTLLANNQMTASTNDLVTHLHYARSEAVKRGVPVSVCASSDGQTCASSYEWGSGWIVFTDDTGSIGSLDDRDQLLRSYLPTGESISILSDQEYVRYQADGSMSL